MALLKVSLFSLFTPILTPALFACLPYYIVLLMATLIHDMLHSAFKDYPLTLGSSFNDPLTLLAFTNCKALMVKIAIV